MVKNSMSSFDLAAWLSENRELMLKSLIDNIYTGRNNEVILRLRLANGDYRYLVIQPGKWVFHTEYDLRRKQLNQVVLFLRKNLRGKVIREIEQLGFDRILRLEISNHNLIVELLPRGTLVLADESNTIIYATEYKEMKDRVIKRGVEYKPPPSRSIHPESLSIEVLRERICLGKDLVRGIVLGLGYPPEVAEEAIGRAGLDKKMKPQDASDEDLLRLYKALKNVYQEAMTSGHGFICYKDSEKSLFTPFKPTHLGCERVEEKESFNNVLEEYVIRTTSAPVVDTGEIEKIKKAIGEHEKIISEYKEKAGEKRSLAEFLATNIDVLEEILECARKVKDQKGWESIISECRHIESYDKHRGVVNIVIHDREIELSIRENIYDYINRLFREAGVLEGKASRAREALEKLREKLQQVVRESREKVEIEKIVIRREWYERFHWLITSEGLLAIGGRDADQNEAIVRKYMEKDDIFIHADIHGAPVVILKTSGRSFSEKSVIEAAYLTACYSRAWKEHMSSVDVYWVRADQVSKSPPPGEYLPKGSFMVYGKRNYIRGLELRLAIGIEIVDEHYPRVIVGPRELVETRSIVHGVLVPGDEEPSRVAKKLREHFVKKTRDDYKVFVKAVPLDDYIRRIPGRSRIIAIVSR